MGLGPEELLPLRGSPSSSQSGGSIDGSRRGSPERGTARSSSLQAAQTGGLGVFAAFITGALLLACLLMATGAVQWSRGGERRRQGGGELGASLCTNRCLLHSRA